MTSGRSVRLGCAGIRPGSFRSFWVPAHPPPPGNCPVDPAGVLPSTLSTSLREAFRICCCLCLWNSGFHQDSVSSWKAGVLSASSCAVETDVYSFSITLRDPFEGKVWTAVHEDHTVKASFSRLWKPEKSPFLKESPSEALPSNFSLTAQTLERQRGHVMERHLSLTFRGWVLAWWPHCSRPECPQRSVFGWVCCWNQRSESRLVLFECSRVDRGAECVQLQHVGTPEAWFCGVCAAVTLAPSAASRAAARLCWDIAVGTPLSPQPPSTHQRREGSCSSITLLNKYLLASSDVLGAMEKNEGKLFLHTLTTSSFLDFKRENQASFI